MGVFANCSESKDQTTVPTLSQLVPTHCELQNLGGATISFDTSVGMDQIACTCMSVTLRIRRQMRVRRLVICELSGFTIFFHIFS
jgi:hypothetical protein